MKKSLENIISVTKLALASSLSALSIYAQEPFQIKTQDGNWSTEVPATLYFKSTLGNTGTDPKKDPTKQFKTQVYFSGRKTSDNMLEFMYITTDSKKPALDAPTIDNNKTKILFYGEGNSSVEIKYQKAIMLNNKGEIKLEDTVPKERASSTLMKFGINLTDKANEKIKDYILFKTAGLLDINVKEGLTKYCEKQTQEITRDAKENTGYELAINNIPLWTRDTNFAIRNKQIGWIIGVSALSKDKKEVPLAIYHHLALKRDEKQEEGTLDAYTEAFKLPATIEQKTKNSLEGIWFAQEVSDKHKKFITFVITSEGNLFPLGIESDPRNGGRTRISKLKKIGNEIEALNCRIEKDLKISETGKEERDRGELKIKEINPNSLKLIYKSGNEEEPLMLKKLEGW
jgi:hypothetical protein